MKKKLKIKQTTNEVVTKKLIGAQLFSKEENIKLVESIEKYGSKFQYFAQEFQGKTELQLRNQFHYYIKKKFFKHFPQLAYKFPKTIQHILKCRSGLSQLEVNYHEQLLQNKKYPQAEITPTKENLLVKKEKQAQNFIESTKTNQEPHSSNENFKNLNLNQNTKQCISQQSQSTIVSQQQQSYNYVMMVPVYYVPCQSDYRYMQAVQQSQQNQEYYDEQQSMLHSIRNYQLLQQQQQYLRQIQEIQRQSYISFYTQSSNVLDSSYKPKKA